jgi:hypothetical protein
MTNREVMKLFKKLYEISESRRRRRAFGKIRREFARAGYRLDHFRDSQLEAALRHWNNDVSSVTVNAKTIYRTMKRLKQPRGKHVQRLNQ